MNSLRESERRASTRLSDSRARVTHATAEHEQIRHALDEARHAHETSRQERLDAQHAADDAEVERTSCDEELREATDWAARTEAHAEALARALDELSGAGGRAIIGDLEGVLGAFLDLIEIEKDGSGPLNRPRARRWARWSSTDDARRARRSRRCAAKRVLA